MMGGAEMPKSNLFNEESREAAESIAKSAPALRYRIESWFFSRGLEGATSDEVLVHFDVAYQTGSARVTELKQAGKIVPSGRRRRTRTGRWAAVLVHRNVALLNEDKVAPSKHQYNAVSNWALVCRSELAILEEAARYGEADRVRSEWKLVLKSWRKLRAYIREITS
jgi:hypothetical protein